MDFFSSQLLITYVFILIAGIFVFLAITHILYQKRTPSSMISWLMAVFFLPYVAVPLYFLVGIRKREEKQKKSYLTFHNGDESGLFSVSDSGHAVMKILEKNGMPPAMHSNSISLVTSDQKAFVLLMEEIANAKACISIATYLFEKDATTLMILEALSKKAKEGIKVRLLLDIVGSFGVYVNQSLFKTLRKAGGEVSFFVPFLAKPFQSYVNLRNHRKIYLFDRSIVLSGGMNLSDAYLGMNGSKKRWTDIIYRLEGPCAEHFYQLFANDWTFATDHQLVWHASKTKNYAGESIAQMVPSGPDIPRDALYEALLSAIYEAKERIWIVTPYFVPDENIMQSLIIAHHKGVDVKLITPGESDHMIADLARSSYMRELYEEGVEVILYEGEMLHAKAILFDTSSVMLGSLNLDNRSLFLNYEVVTFVYSGDIISEVERWIAALMSRGQGRLAAPSKVREAFENIMKVFAPVL